MKNLPKCNCGGDIEVIITTGTAYTISCKKCVAGVTFKTKGEAERAWIAHAHLETRPFSEMPKES